jgi:D-alanyl-D-alanine carboxypeptidase/D-alanyl-D-alanine-endopeptidase (penicillin-binding protein 4)
MRDSGKAGRPARSAPTAAGGSPKGGIAGLLAKHPTAWLASALGVTFLLLGTAAVFAGVAAGSNSSSAAVIPTETAAPPRPQPSAMPAASRLRTCSVAPLVADPRLAGFSGFVANATTGETLFDRNGTAPQRTGSVLKTLTAAAALNVLGPAAQLSTRVIDGSSAGTIVLQGGGDPTLATTTGSFYDGAPQISDLANAAMAAYKAAHPGVPITTIVLDSTMWDPADNWDSSWLRKEQDDGYQAEVTALMINGGREDPTATVSTRTSDPIGDAGRAFASAAGLDNVTFTTGAAIGSTVLAEVKSQPLSTLIDQMLQYSDNILAEMLARVVSKAMGFNGSSASLGQAIPGALVEYGLPTTTLTIRDGSGLSDLNAVSPQFVSLLMAKVLAGVKDLGVILSSLPVAGESGTLAGRFQGANSIAAGAVIAKTGWLDAEYSLGGIIHAADGTALVFAFYSIRDGITADAKEAQDTLATGVFTCGDNLSNN